MDTKVDNLNNLNNLYNIYINDQRNILMLSSISFLCISISNNLKDFFKHIMYLLSIVIIIIIIVYSYFVNSDFKYLVKGGPGDDLNTILSILLSST